MIPIVLAGLILTAPTSADDAPREPRKVALVVGVNDYDHDFPALRFAERDAEKLAEALRENGFDVTLLTGSAKGDGRATAANIAKKLKALLEGGPAARKVRRGDLVVLALSGHGQQISVRGSDQPFFCAADSLPGKAETQLNISEAVDDVIAPYGARNLLLIDACRDVADRNKGKGVIGQDVALKGQTAILFSCGRGQRSYEADELRHGVFTHAVLGGLRGAGGKAGEVTWAALVSHVQDALESDELKKHLPKGSAQTPIATSGQVGRTVLAPSKEDRELAADLTAVREAIKGDGKGIIPTPKPIPINLTRRFAAYKEAADKGKPLGMLFLGLCYKFGTGAAEDDEASAGWLRKAAEAGEPLAMMLMADRALARGREKEPGKPPFGAVKIKPGEAKEAFEWLLKAAEAGDARAMTRVGLCYLMGSGVARDSRRAESWMKKAAADGDPVGKFYVGLFVPKK